MKDRGAQCKVDMQVQNLVRERKVGLVQDHRLGKIHFVNSDRR